MLFSIEKFTASINCAVLGKMFSPDEPNFTIISEASYAIPLYIPSDAFPFPAAIPAT